MSAINKNYNISMEETEVFKLPRRKGGGNTKGMRKMVKVRGVQWR